MKFLSQILNVQLKIAIILLLVCTSSFASNVVVKSEFLEVFTAAGRGYPIFFVIENGENFELLNRKTDWIKIKSEQGQIGWISYLDYAESVHLAKPNTRNVAVRSNWELGAAIGKFSSDNTFSASAAYYMKPTVAVQAEYKKIIGKYSHSNLVSGQFMFQVYRKKLFSPFVSLGMGIIENTPRQSLVNASVDRQNIFFGGGGVNMIPYKRLNLRLMVSNYYLNKSKRSYVDFRFGVYALFG